jgi:hypothetical protein
MPRRTIAFPARIPRRFRATRARARRDQDLRQFRAFHCRVVRLRKGHRWNGSLLGEQGRSGHRRRHLERVLGCLPNHAGPGVDCRWRPGGRKCARCVRRRQPRLPAEWRGEQRQCLRRSGDVLGGNYSGQLGYDSTETRSLSPVLVRSAPGAATPLTGVKAIAMGGSYGCALIQDGTVRCWGMNQKGQLGDDTTQDRRAPVAVVQASGTSTALSGVKAIVAGQSHTCALMQNSELRCWGDNTDAQLGTAAGSQSATPVVVKF